LFGGFMARATSLWIVLDENDKVIAGFTVQHRLGKWLKTIDYSVRIAKVRDEDPTAEVIFVDPADVKDYC
jgi:hypothetical protein